MSKATLKRTIPEQTIEVVGTICDICREEIELRELPIEYVGLNKAKLVQKRLLGDWTDLFRKYKKQVVHDETLIDVVDFEVHYRCAVEAIAAAVRKNKKSIK